MNTAQKQNAKINKAVLCEGTWVKHLGKPDWAEGRVVKCLSNGTAQIEFVYGGLQTLVTKSANLEVMSAPLDYFGNELTPKRIAEQRRYLHCLENNFSGYGVSEASEAETEWAQLHRRELESDFHDGGRTK